MHPALNFTGPTQKPQGRPRNSPSRQNEINDTVNVGSTFGNYVERCSLARVGVLENVCFESSPMQPGNVFVCGRRWKPNRYVKPTHPLVKTQLTSEKKKTSLELAKERQEDSRAIESNQFRRRRPTYGHDEHARVRSILSSMGKQPERKRLRDNGTPSETHHPSGRSKSAPTKHFVDPNSTPEGSVNRLDNHKPKRQNQDVHPGLPLRSRSDQTPGRKSYPSAPSKYFDDDNYQFSLVPIAKKQKAPPQNQILSLSSRSGAKECPTENDLIQELESDTKNPRPPTNGGVRVIRVSTPIVMDQDNIEMFTSLPPQEPSNTRNIREAWLTSSSKESHEQDGVSSATTQITKVRPDSKQKRAGGNQIEIAGSLNQLNQYGSRTPTDMKRKKSPRTVPKVKSDIIDLMSDEEPEALTPASPEGSFSQGSKTSGSGSSGINVQRGDPDWSNNFAIKVVLGSLENGNRQIRRFRLGQILHADDKSTPTPSLIKLRELVKQVTGIPEEETPTTFLYVDEDGDEISLSTDQELVTALLQSIHQEVTFTKLFAVQDNAKHTLHKELINPENEPQPTGTHLNAKSGLMDQNADVDIIVDFSDRLERRDDPEELKRRVHGHYRDLKDKQTIQEEPDRTAHTDQEGEKMPHPRPEQDPPFDCTAFVESEMATQALAQDPDLLISSPR